ncbi:hypothetical protein NE237_024270 [Protea cynaroides]|uniref:Protein kinase domain-containing protein n=1 Tax=Protea cynaroides TaxID=273540 RepID=A0A9Q0HFK1_9MAGN|nr:hypothetical protein NE237_024270 [Protea cynaroides]
MQLAGTMGWPVEHGKASSTLQQTTNVVGTMGYMAPEYVITGKASKETDIYSFGIVLLEIASGRKPVEFTADPSEVSLVEWVWELYGRRKHLEAVDPSLGVDPEKQQILECLIIVGLWCAQEEHNLRPSIGQAINVLKFESPLPILPCTMGACFSSSEYEYILDYIILCFVQQLHQCFIFFSSIPFEEYMVSIVEIYQVQDYSSSTPTLISLLM